MGGLPRSGRQPKPARKTNKVPVTFLGGHSAWKGLIGLFTVPDGVGTPFCRVFTHWEKWGRLQDDFRFDCVSMTYLIDSASDTKAWWVLGKNGEAVEIRKGVPTVEQIPGAGLNVPKPRYGYVDAIKNIGGELYVCGYGRQVYRREEGQWVSLVRDLLTQESAKGFMDIDGTGRACLVAVGWAGEIYAHDGVTWKKDESPTKEHLASVRCLSEKDIWIAGDNGVVLHGRVGNWRLLRDEAFAEEDWYSVEEFDGQIYLAGNQQLARVEGDAIKPVDVGLDREITTHRLHAKEGLLWSIGEKDILVFDGKAWRELLHPDNA